MVVVEICLVDCTLRTDARSAWLTAAGAVLLWGVGTEWEGGVVHCW